MGTRGYIHNYPGEAPGVTITNSSSTEPATKVGSIVAAVTGLVVVLNDVVFTDLLSPSQDVFFYGVLTVAGPFVTALITRKFVWSPSSVKILIDDFLETIPKK